MAGRFGRLAAMLARLSQPVVIGDWVRGSVQLFDRTRRDYSDRRFCHILNRQVE